MLTFSLQSISCLVVLQLLYHKSMHCFLHIELDIFYILLKDLKAFTASLAFKGSYNFYTDGIFAVDSLWTKILLCYSKRFQHFQSATNSCISLSVSWNSINVNWLGDTCKLAWWVLIQKVSICQVGRRRRRKKKKQWWKLYHFYCFGWILLELILSTCSNYLVFDQNTFLVFSLNANRNYTHTHKPPPPPNVLLQH